MSPDAVRRWSDELAQDPRSLAFVPLADELRRRRRLAEALAIVERGLERHPYLADAHESLARVCMDLGDEQRAHDEWEMTLRIDPHHLPALKGLGFLAFRRNDVATAERLLQTAQGLDAADQGLVAALARVRARLAGAPAGRLTPVQQAAQQARAGTASAASRARALFAELLGDGDRTALLLDRDGLVLAGMYVDEEGRDIGDQIGAELSGVGEEASRALEQLGLGRWVGVTIEAQHATVALAPVSEGAVVLVAAARDTPIGFVRRLLQRAARRATAWMEAL